MSEAEPKSRVRQRRITGNKLLCGMDVVYTVRGCVVGVVGVVMGVVMCVSARVGMDAEYTLSG